MCGRLLMRIAIAQLYASARCFMDTLQEKLLLEQMIADRDAPWVRIIGQGSQ